MLQGLAEDDEVASLATKSDIGHKDCCNGFTDSSYLRYQMLRIKQGDVDSVQLPPCKFKVPL